MRIDNTTAGFLARKRTMIMIISLLLFMTPLALFFQVTTGDNDFCGTWCPRMFYAIRQGAGIKEVIGGIMRAYMGVALLAGAVISTFFLGRYWCSHVCPIGGAGELGSRLVPARLKIDYSAIPAPAVRYGYLGVYLIAPLAGIGSLCCNYCNFATVPRLFGAAFVEADLAYFFRAYGIINLSLFILLAVVAKGGRAYCNFVCPVGALDALSNRLGVRVGKRVKVIPDKCNSCGNCTEVCPTWAIDVSEKARIDQLSCISCRKCQEICPEGAICYGKTQ